MKKEFIVILIVLLYSTKLFSEGTFFGTSINLSATTTGFNDQNAFILNAKWNWNIGKIFEIGVVYSKLISDVNADFIDKTAKTSPLLFLNYGGLDLGFYPYYDDNFTIKTGIILAGGGYKYTPKDNLKFDEYSDLNINVYEPQLEFGYFINGYLQIYFNLTYRYIDIDNSNFSSTGAGFGVKYGIFK